MWNTNKRCKCRCKHTKTLINKQHPPTLNASTSTKAARGTSAPTSPPEFHDSLSPCSLNHWHCGMTCCFCIVDSELIVWTNSYAVSNINSTKNHQNMIMNYHHSWRFPHIKKTYIHSIPVINSTQNHSHPTTNCTETSNREAFSLSWARSRCAASNLLVSSWSFCVHSSHFQRLMGCVN